MLNISITNGYFPSCLKIAKIIPIFKKGVNSDPSNYRPISLLPYLSKIFERIIHSRLTNYLTTNSIISSHQFGFQRGISTLDAVVSFTEFIYNGLNSKQSILNIFVDYAKAFDTVNHQILLRKLNKYGISGNTNTLFAGFLKDRKQYVYCNSAVSNVKTSNIGVPQGSILGPVLFLLVINDLPALSDNFAATMFADDCCLQFRGSNMNSLVSTCNDDLSLFEQWSNANKLSINVRKTQCMFISNTENILQPNSISIFNVCLDIVEKYKFLGVEIDNNVRFNDHIISIRGKISKTIGILFRLRDTLPRSSLKSIYYALIHPYIEYCLPIYGGTYEVHLNPLFVLQKSALRAINNAGYYDETNILFYNSKILKLHDLYKLDLAVYLYKHPELRDAHRRNHSYPTRFSSELLPPMERLRSSSQSVIYNAINIWNSLPSDLQNSTSLDIFKTRYKELLFAQYAN